jgi:mono/diheme cytochrome c family protein
MRVGFVLLLAALAIAFSALDAGAADRIELPQGPNRDLVYSRCRTCHDLQYVVESAGITSDNWEALIEDMGQYGLRIPADERQKIVQYLVTYLGAGGPKAAPPSQQVAQTPADGKAVFARQCSACHQAEGTGMAKTFPPLASNPDLFIDRLFPVYVVLNGLEGQATIKGEQYNGVMPPFDHLSDAELAAVLAYVRSAWGNDKLRPAGFVDVDAAAVGKARQKPMKPKEVHAYRAAHL